MQRTLIKLGGSLLNLPDLAERLEKLLKCNLTAPMLLVGGGGTVDLVRDWDATFRLAPEASHKLAIQAMGLNAHMVASLKVEFDFVVVSSMLEAETAMAAGRIPILNAFEVMSALEADLPQNRHLPKTWDVTSDSIAAWIAHQWKVPHLLLLKSLCCPISNGVHASRDVIAAALQKSQTVDPLFSRHVQHAMALSWCNFRKSPQAIDRLW